MPSNYYIITQNMPGYLPESDPLIFVCDDDRAPLPQVLEHIFSEVDRFADEDFDSDEEERKAEWYSVLTEIVNDQTHASDLSEDGVSYDLPDGYIIEATKRTHDELIQLGYIHEEDF